MQMLRYHKLFYLIFALGYLINIFSIMLIALYIFRIREC